MKNSVASSESASESAPIQSLQNFCRSAGITPITAWRFRKRGWLNTVNIAGRQYLTSEGIAEFKQRAAKGDFAKEHNTPFRKAA